MIGNTTLVSSLVSKSRASALRGAILLSGPTSQGKATLARRLVRYSLCRGTKDDSCSCTSCVKGLSGPDVVHAAPNQYGNILSSMLEPAFALFSEQSPTGSPVRVLLIEDADKMHHTSCNDLLKSLESLKDEDLVIMTSSEPWKMLDTLVSRTQHIRLKPLTREEICKVLHDKGHRAAWVQELSKASGSLSLGLMGNIDTYKEGAVLSVRLFKGIRTLDLVRCMATIDKIKGDDMATAVLETLSLRVSDAMCSRMGAQRHVVFGADKEENADLEAYTESYTLSISDALHEGLTRIRAGSPSRATLSHTVTACIARLAATKKHELRTKGQECN